MMISIDTEDVVKKQVIVMTLVVLLFCRAQPLFSQSFIDNGDGTVTDNDTGLIWQQGESSTMPWLFALSYCEELVLPAGQTDWRLPNQKELQSIVNYDTYDPSIDTTFFPGTVTSYYWTSTTRANNLYEAWMVYFNVGGVGTTSKTGSYYVRCVRSGL